MTSATPPPPEVNPPTSEGNHLTLNGELVEVRADPKEVLLLVLRNELGQVGVRTGCGVGECGSCTVLLDGVAERSCSISVDAVAGREVTTPEGIGQATAPGWVQRCFLERQAAQCGYCINGMIMAVEGLARRESVTREELVEELTAHLCRCGTYGRILDAAEVALGLDGKDGSGRRARAWLESPPALPEAESSGRPAILERYQDVSDWVRLAPDGTFGVFTGKVELGQGLRGALARIAAAHLGVDPTVIEVHAPTTDNSPDEGQTAASNSMEESGTAVAWAATAFRRLLSDRVTEVAGSDVSSYTIVGDAVALSGDDEPLSLGRVLDSGPISGQIVDADRPDWHRLGGGTADTRADLSAKLSGAPAYLHDWATDRALHARVSLPPAPNAVLTEVDEAAVEEVRADPRVVDVIIDGRIAMVVAEQEWDAKRAAGLVASALRWETAPLTPSADFPETSRDSPGEDYVAASSEQGADGEVVLATSYRQPYQLHGPVAPSCALAELAGQRLTVWSHTQGVHPLRRELAALLSFDVDDIVIRHLDGPGCYGQTLADDAAAFAARAACAVPGRLVRFLFEVEDEFAWDPAGSAMLAELSATQDADGSIAGWSHRTFTDVHGTRSDGSGTRLMVSWLSEAAREPQWPGAKRSGARNAVPLYNFDRIDAVATHLRGPLRVGALRSLGAFLNVFASESFIDEVAFARGCDPLSFRLEYLEDQRAIAVLERAAELIGWQSHDAPSGGGVGLAFSRYKGSKAYVAQAVQVRIDTEEALGRIDVERVVTVCDAGKVVSPDGLANQLEGGTLQGISRALIEEVRLTTEGIASHDWTAYPALRADRVPHLETVILDRTDAAPLGAGEAATPPVVAAIANAVDDAVGVRLRELPMTPRSFERRLLEMDETEAQRVLLT